MKDTGSIHMATRWSSYDGTSAPAMSAGVFRGLWRVPWGDEGSVMRVLSSAGRRFLVLGVACLAASCVTPLVSAEFEADPRAARMTADEARDFLSSALGPECARLAKANATPTGEARVSVQVTPSGEVLKSHLTQRTGDARIDELFGTTAARMKFDANGAQTSAYTGRLRMGYSCSGESAVGTIDLF